MTSWLRATSGDQDAPFCLPEGSTNCQYIRVLVAYLRSHPEKLHEKHIALTLSTFHEAWPCKLGRPR